MGVGAGGHKGQEGCCSHYRSALTFKKTAGKVDTQVGVPAADAAPGGRLGNLGRLYLLELGEHAALRAEADDDLGNA